MSKRTQTEPHCLQVGKAAAKHTARQEPRPPTDGVHNRRHPAHGVKSRSDLPTIVFLTVCAKDRKRWLATHQVHVLLREVWASATAWLVGRYVIMPDHIHLFAAPGRPLVSLDNWVQYWKSIFTKQCPPGAFRRWETDHWDTRLRDIDGYRAKWEYVR